MEYRNYKSREDRIISSSASSIRARIEWGLLVLHDPDYTHKNGRLLHGAIEKLVARAHANGFMRVSRSEVQRRLQAARTYWQESQIASVLMQFDSWNGLIQANFPAIEAAEGEPPYDPRPLHVKRDGAERDLGRAGNNPELHGQLTLTLDLPGIPTDTYGPDAALTELIKCDAYLDEINEEMYAQGKADSKTRKIGIHRLVEAAHGDTQMSWADATRALREAGNA